MQSIEQLTQAWNALSQEDRQLQWGDFTEMLDAGDAGYHRFYLILMPIWAEGEIAAAAAVIEPQIFVTEGLYKPFHRVSMAA